MCSGVKVGLVYVGTHRISLVALVVAGVPARLYNSPRALWPSPHSALRLFHDNTLNEGSSKRSS